MFSVYHYGLLNIMNVTQNNNFIHLKFNLQHKKLLYINSQ